MAAIIWDDGLDAFTSMAMPVAKVMAEPLTVGTVISAVVVVEIVSKAKFGDWAFCEAEKVPLTGTFFDRKFIFTVACARKTEAT